VRAVVGRVRHERVVGDAELVEQIQHLTDEYVKKVDDILHQKEKEILQV